MRAISLTILLTMLSISLPMRGGGAGDYYIKLSQEEYYTKSLGSPGQWFGEGATALGLNGSVSPDQIKNLLEGKSQDGSKTLVQIQNWKDRERQSGWDFTLSAPKSLSALWSQVGDATRKKLEEAHVVAVKKALVFLEKEAAITRRGQGGKIFEKAKVVWVLFQHGTSRANDPQVHTHCVLINLSLRNDGTTGALRSKEFFRLKMAAGAIYQLELANQLREQLNLKVVGEKVGFRIEGVPKELCREFSKRRRDIEVILQQGGDFSAEASRKAAELTRPVKNELPRDQAITLWQDTGRAFGWGPEQAQKLVEEAAQSKKQEQTKSNAPLIVKVAGQDKKSQERVIKQLLHEAQKKGKSADEFASAIKEAQKKPYIRFESRMLFPRAPLLSPFANWRIPTLIVGENKINDWWGKVRWSMETPLGQLQFRDKYLFPNAWECNPLKNLAFPRLVLRQDTQWKWRDVIWKKNTIFGQVQLRWKAIFPHAIENSLAHKMALPAFRIQTKRPDFKIQREPNQTKQKHQEQEKTMSH
jgi:conjugative relaxase-like TrwC/TraI family protein